jgi:hypothetical protein
MGLSSNLRYQLLGGADTVGAGAIYISQPLTDLKRLIVMML